MPVINMQGGGRMAASRGRTGGGFRSTRVGGGQVMTQSRARYNTPKTSSFTYRRGSE